MGEYFAKDYSGAPFELFGPAHLVALAIVLLINLSLPWLFRRAGETARRRFRYTLAVILLVNEAAWHLWNYATGQWTVQTMLPLHMCSILVFLSAYLLVTGNYGIYEFIYFLGIAGATQALLTPDAGRYGFPHFRFFQAIISHGAIVTTAVYMTTVEKFRPTWRSLVRVMAWTNIYMLAVGVVNAVLGSNYLFIARKPETASLLDILAPWPWYILQVELIAVTLLTLLYLPYAWKDHQAARESDPSPA